MYFDERPKNTLRDLFGRRDELKRLEKAVSEKRPLILLTGPRRVGKTSLLYTFLESRKIKSIRIDIRESVSGSEILSNDVITLLRDGLQEFLNSNKTLVVGLIEALKTIKGIEILGNGVTIDYNPNNVNLKGLFKSIDNWAKNHRTVVVIAVDEIQKLAKSKNFKFDSLVAALYDNYRHISIILTGSEMGLLYEFLGIEDASADLHGRSFENIRLNPLNDSDAKKFLMQGFKQRGYDPDANIPTITTINTAVKKLGGIIGWLATYGRECLTDKKISEKSILSIQKRGSRQAREEFKSFLTTRANPVIFKKIMNALLQYQYTSQDDFIRLYVESKNTEIQTTELIDNEFIVKKDQRYFFTDPLLQFAFEEDITDKNKTVKKRKYRIKNKNKTKSKHKSS